MSLCLSVVNAILYVFLRGVSICAPPERNWVFSPSPKCFCNCSAPECHVCFPTPPRLLASFSLPYGPLPSALPGPQRGEDSADGTGDGHFRCDWHRVWVWRNMSALSLKIRLSIPFAPSFWNCALSYLLAAMRVRCLLINDVQRLSLKTRRSNNKTKQNKTKQQTTTKTQIKYIYIYIYIIYIYICGCTYALTYCAYPQVTYTYIRSPHWHHRSYTQHK